VTWRWKLKPESIFLVEETLFDAILKSFVSLNLWPQWVLRESFVGVRQEIVVFASISHSTNLDPAGVLQPLFCKQKRFLSTSNLPDIPTKNCEPL
jgi:hypothetical protein